MVSTLDSPTTTRERFPAWEVPQGYECTAFVVVLRLPRGTLNRGSVCVCMHSRLDNVPFY